MNINETDILIVGAGPSGATLARKLALAERDVTIIDKATFPREKVCGGGVPKRAGELLDFDYSAVVQTKVNYVTLSGGWADSLTLEVPEVASIVSRTEFDNLLKDKAVEAGAKFFENCALKHIELKNGKWISTILHNGKKHEIASKYICACDGSNSRVAKINGIEIKQGFALEAYIDIPEDATEEEKSTTLFDFTCVRDGYGWVFPFAGKYGVGIGATRWKTKDLPKKLNKMCRQLKITRGVTPEKIKGAPLPFFTSPLEWYAKNGLYLTGDAAGLCDPLTGEGIFFAIKSAILASEAILKDDDNLYNMTLNEEIIPDLIIANRYSRKAKWVPKWLHGFVMGSDRYREYAKKFTELLAGKVNFRQLYKDMHKGKEFKFK
jgi:geranylgeranyl reductase family protein